MSKVITNVGDAQKVTVIKASGGNIKKITCPNCKQQAHPVPDGKGGTVNRCHACNTTFTSTRI